MLLSGAHGKDGRQPKWKTTKIEDDKINDEKNGRRPKRKTTKMEDNQKFF